MKGPKPEFGFRHVPGMTPEKAEVLKAYTKLLRRILNP
jgi:hypothetical protein